MIITQTLQLIDDLEAPSGTLHRMLRPGGVVLATLPGISQTHHGDWGGHWRWNFTALSARTLFESAFPPDDVTVETRGNVLAATAFLQGLVAEDLRPDELDHDDRDYQVSILVRAEKASPGDVMAAVGAPLFPPSARSWFAPCARVTSTWRPARSRVGPAICGSSRRVPIASISCLARWGWPISSGGASVRRR